MSDDEDLREEVRRLREEVTALQRRLDALESTPDRGRDPPDAAPGSDATAEADPSADSRPPEAPTAAAASEAETGTGAAEEATGGRDWELAVGVRWLGLAGALALVVGVVFFVRLAIEMGLLGPLGRIAAGTLGGSGLLIAGRFAATRRGYVRWGRLAAGAGLAVAYFSVYAAYGFESYRSAIGTPLWAVLAAMTLLVAGTAVVSIRDGAPLVAGEAFLLGYVTAYLSTDAATLALTPVYALLLAGGLVAITRVRPWSRLVVSSVPATFGVLALWRADVSPPEWAVVAAAVAAFLLYLAASDGLRRYDAEFDARYRAQLAALTALNGGSAAGLLETALRSASPPGSIEGVGTAAVALALAAFYLGTDRRSGARRDETAAAASIVLLASGVGLAVGTFAATVGALAVVCLGVAAARFEGAPGFRVGAHLVAALTAVKLLAVDARELAAFDAAAPLATLTGRPAAFALAVVVLYALAVAFRARPASLLDAERGERVSVDAAYAVAATGLAVVGLGLELSGVGVSVAWALFGFALLGIGLSVDVRGVRLLGVGVLGLATAKVFLLDTGGLDPVARTLSFLVLGGVLLAASYVYARSRPDVELPGRNRE